jgi:hypothetical protein
MAQILVRNVVATEPQADPQAGTLLDRWPVVVACNSELH